MSNEKRVNDLEDRFDVNDEKISEADRELAERIYNALETKDKIVAFFLEDVETDKQAEALAQDVIAIAEGQK